MCIFLRINIDLSLLKRGRYKSSFILVVVIKISMIKYFDIKDRLLDPRERIYFNHCRLNRDNLHVEYYDTHRRSAFPYQSIYPSYYRLNYDDS